MQWDGVVGGGGVCTHGQGWGRGRNRGQRQVCSLRLLAAGGFCLGQTWIRSRIDLEGGCEGAPYGEVKFGLGRPWRCPLLPGSLWAGGMGMEQR